MMGSQASCLILKPKNYMYKTESVKDYVILLFEEYV